MRFVAGGDAVAELLLAGALRRSCWQGRCGGVADRGAAAELLAGALWQRCCCQGASSGRRCRPWVPFPVSGGPVSEALQGDGANWSYSFDFLALKLLV